LLLLLLLFVAVDSIPIMEGPCTLLIHYDSAEPPNLTELKQQLEHGDDYQKIAALKRAIVLLLNGEKLPNILMTIIRFVLVSKNHTIKKLVLLYWEALNKHGPDGKLLPEMILVWFVSLTQCHLISLDLTVGSR
jgi:coatomer subunit beta